MKPWPAALLLGALGLGALGLGGCAAEPPEPRAAGTAAATPRGPACDGSFRVTNASTRIISRIHLRDAALTNWGPDMLGQEVLSPGRTSTLRASAPGVYDMRLFWADRQAVERRRITICSGTQVSVGNFGINLP
ncbi:hypothetical protein [Sediminicoccus sp. KRV36]|uniref:hypothetical protein n=1 Tax=Sediminicoccus sp. KRV36 TaxID=3133721 RepID=UPI00200DF237|nr:hypothetical protein [Sediminicoccus rosea]UPY37136.1 hypothetical protein LHU95_00115 [Sediminicoccus rosea]